VTTLEERLVRYLEQQEEARSHGITLESVYRTARDLADQMLAGEAKADSWREELRREIASLGKRIRDLEGDHVRLQSANAILESKLTELYARLEEVERRLRAVPEAAS